MSVALAMDNSPELISRMRGQGVSAGHSAVRGGDADAQKVNYATTVAAQRAVIFLTENGVAAVVTGVTSENAAIARH